MGVESIAGASMAMHAQQLQVSVGTAVLKMGLDQEKQTGEMLTQIMGAPELARSVQPHLGGNIDISA